MPNVRQSELISGVWHVEPTVHGDQRGMFIETYRREWFPNGREMLQGNRSNKQQGALVGLHYHLHQADYWYCPVGTIRVVLHDLRESVFLADTVYVMSKSPGRFVVRREIDLPRPRDLEITYTPEFTDIVHELRGHIGAMRKDGAAIGQ